MSLEVTDNVKNYVIYHDGDKDKLAYFVYHGEMETIDDLSVVTAVIIRAHKLSTPPLILSWRRIW